MACGQITSVQNLCDTVDHLYQFYSLIVTDLEQVVAFPLSICAKHDASPVLTGGIDGGCQRAVCKGYAAVERQRFICGGFNAVAPGTVMQLQTGNVRTFKSINNLLIGSFHLEKKVEMVYD